MKYPTLLNIFFLLFTFYYSPSNSQERETIVNTPSGSVRGLINDQYKIKEFKGIQYAKAERFEAPKPVDSWAGVKNAKSFASNCPQVRRFNLTEESLNEDCLFLNVTMPSDLKEGERLPVMVWIPGGGFVGGGSNLYNTGRFSELGRLIIVTLNYRLGALGFMPHPAMDAASNGDLGLLDQRAAFKWVKKNIEAFGGDRDNVTIAGESAGAGSICMHLASPDQVNGLFDKALLISGACLQSLPTLDQALDNPIWKRLSYNPADHNRRFRCPVPGEANYSDANSLSCLKNVPVKDLLEAQTYEAGNGILSFIPVIGNQVVPQSFSRALNQDKIVKVPLLMGGATNEIRLYVAYDVLGDNPNKTKYPVTRENLEKYYLPAFYGSDKNAHQKIVERYFENYNSPVNLNGSTLGSMLSDFNPHVGINNCMYLRTANTLNQVKGMPPIYQFEFSDPNALVLGVGIAKGKDPLFPLGAVHSSILNYLYPNFSNTAAQDAKKLKDTSHNLGDLMIQYFSAFMKSGNPNLAKAPKWLAYDGTPTAPSSGNVMLFRPSNSHMYSAYGGKYIDLKQGHQCAFWNLVYPE